MEKKHSTLSLVIACAVTAAATAVVVLAAFYYMLGGSTGLELFSKVNAVRQITAAGYVGETDWTDVADGAASGMVSALGDRWSYYMTAEEYKAYQDRSTNTSSGIGVTVTADEKTGGFEIFSVTAGSPAEAAGIRTGQIIVSAAGQDVTGMTTAQLREIIMAQQGQFQVRLLNEDGSSHDVTVYTDTFYSSPVTYELLENGIGYIRISNFEQGAAENAISAIEELEAQGMSSLIFDVRTNPGGRLSELIELLDYILPEGELFISVDREGNEQVYSSDAACISYPMAVLIDANSYSAAEFFAAALSEYDYAATVGQASTGKGRSQVTYELSDGSAVHISTNRYLTPNRVDLSEQGGLIPDIEVELEAESDTQLEAATKYLS